MMATREMVPGGQGGVLGKIALEMDRALKERAGAGARGRTTPRPLARGPGWSAHDVICTCGPADRPFDEAHRQVSVAIVVAGTFQYRTGTGRYLMSPGALMLGNPGQGFQCDHAHRAGDRCVAFHFAPDWFERLTADLGVPQGRRRLLVPRVPPLKKSAGLVARVLRGLATGSGVAWEVIALEAAAQAATLGAGGAEPARHWPPRALARVTDTVRRIESAPSERWTLARLAAEARLSPFHYLRTFKVITGVTPHQFILRSRLRAAALHLADAQDRVMEVALAAGFDDLSTFNHAFRAEFGVTPLAFRRRLDLPQGA